MSRALAAKPDLWLTVIAAKPDLWLTVSGRAPQLASRIAAIP